MLVLSCIFYILWQRQFHLQAQTMTRSQEEVAPLLPFVLLGNSSNTEKLQEQLQQCYMATFTQECYVL